MPLTVSQILTAVRDRLDESASGQWTDTMLKRWMNEAMRDVARRTKHVKDTKTFTTIAGQAEYIVASDVIEIEQAYYAPDSSRQIPLIARSWEGMNNVWGQYQSQQSGDPALWTTWGVPPALKFRLYPVPSLSNKTVTLYVARLPAAITEDDAVNNTAVDFPDAWCDILKDYVEASALRRDRDPRWQEAWGFYDSRVANLVDNSDYMHTSMEMIADPLVSGGVIPRWLADPGWN